MGESAAEAEEMVAGADVGGGGSSNGSGVVEIDEDLHSRQLAVYGRETMRQLFASNVLISGLNGLGAEIGACSFFYFCLVVRLMFSCVSLWFGNTIVNIQYNSMYTGWIAGLQNTAGTVACNGYMGSNWASKKADSLRHLCSNV